MKRLPNWLKIVLAAFAVLFVLGAIFGKAPEPKPVAATPAAPPATSTTPVTSAAPVPVSYTVESVTDGATVVVKGSDGSSRTVRVLGVTAPVVGNGCYGLESLGWATSTLSGKAVTLGAETAQGVAVTLAGGQDYAALAIQGGYLKYAADAAVPALAAAETAAKQAVSGLWGPPCNGTIDAPAPTPTPAPPVTKAAPVAPPVETTEDAPEPDSSVYYKNCAAARAAHAAPIHVGEPGYRKELDRDGDGTACDR
ncbi:thermonuclease family protein [Amycolatopsis sp. MEPSY49]|uniref:thermonuclease family protein n=1 Tax=Amycolatopsis sp. MEPSY49 TaxID=3151600 RepID=UPI003EFA2AE9